jgi:hypothetical protein
MSYAKIIATPLNYILFSYNHGDIMFRVKEETQYRASRTIKENDDTAIDEMGMTDFESDILDRYITDAIYEIGKKLNLLTQGLNLPGTGAISFYKDRDVKIAIVDHAQYNNNLLTVIDRILEVILTNYILLKWWEKCGRYDEMKLSDSAFWKAMDDLTEYIFEFRKPDIDTEPSEIIPSTGMVIEIQTGIEILSGEELTVSHSLGISAYTVFAYTVSGASIPGFDSLITSRTVDEFKATLSSDYSNITIVIVGASESPATAEVKTTITSIESIIAGEPFVYTHNFGSPYYFAQAIQPGGLNVPGFDDLITSRDKDTLEFTSGISYDSLMIILIGKSE